MTLRWHTVVLDCNDVRAQAAWWSTVLDWQLIHETDSECVIIPSWVNETVMHEMPRDRIGPGMVFVHAPEPKAGKNRLHVDLAPNTGSDRDAELARLERLGATQVAIGQPPDASWTVLADPEGNEFCVLSAETP